jgi:glycosyltransferase involved in cell wall biosynthesis
MVGTRYLSPYLDASGYGEASRNFLVAFNTVGANVKAQKASFTGSQTYPSFAAEICRKMEAKTLDYKIKILHVTPDNYKTFMEPGKHHIGHLFWETSKLPKSWVGDCNRLDEIWTGTQYGADVIRNSGVTVPVIVIPEAIDTNIPSKVRPYLLPNFKGTVFYSVFEWTERKNPKALLFAFWKTFRGQNDVCLLLKVHKAGQNDRGLRDILLEAKAWRNSLVWKDTPRVFIYTDILDGEGMNRFHETGDLYVSAHRGEGWGLPVCEATMHLKPIISVGYGGIFEYFKRRDYMAVEFAMSAIDQVHNTYYEPGMEWAEADPASLEERLRKAYDLFTTPKTHTVLSKFAYSARGVVKEVCSYENVGNKMVARINDIAFEKGWDE